MNDKLISQLEAFKPWNEQEAQDRIHILNALRAESHIFERSHLAEHMTASAWVVNSDFSKVLLVHHRIFDAWTWPGGHADGDTDLLAVAMKEVREECGVSLSLKPVMEEPLSLEILAVHGHEKRQAYVSSHLHLNLTYLLMASDTEKLQSCKEENSGVKWFLTDELIKVSDEKWMRERIYPKLIGKVAATTIR